MCVDAALELETSVACALLAACALLHEPCHFLSYICLVACCYTMCVDVAVNWSLLLLVLCWLHVLCCMSLATSFHVHVSWHVVTPCALMLHLNWSLLLLVLCWLHVLCCMSLATSFHVLVTWHVVTPCALMLRLTWSIHAGLRQMR